MSTNSNSKPKSFTKLSKKSLEKGLHTTRNIKILTNLGICITLKVNRTPVDLRPRKKLSHGMRAKEDK